MEFKSRTDMITMEREDGSLSQKRCTNNTFEGEMQDHGSNLDTKINRST